MKNYWLFVLVLCAAASARAQVTVSPHSRLMFQNSPYGFVSKLAEAPPRTIGSTYYSDNFLTADVFLKDETKLEGLKIKLDLKSQNLEILHEGTIKMIPGDKVLSFQWATEAGTPEVFLRISNAITDDGLRFSGFVKLLTDTEPFQLMQYHTVEMLSSNYNAALDVGSKDHQIVRKTRSFIAKENLLLEVKGSRKRFTNDFREIFHTDVSTIVREFDIDPKKDEELVLLVQQLNFANPG